MTKFSAPSSIGDVATPLTPTLPIDPKTGKPREKRFITVLRAEKWWIDKARLDPFFFIQYVTDKEPARHHRLWLKNIFDFTDEGRKDGTYRLNIIAPRDSAKTTIGMYSLAWFMARFPLSTNMVISVSAKQAEARLEMVRDVIRNNTRFQNVFPWIGVDERQRNTIQEFSIFADAMYDPRSNKVKSISYNVWRSLVSRSGSLKDPTMYVSGSGGKGVIGRRISGMMILDDIIDEAYLRAELQDEVYEYIMRTLIPCIMENAKVINIGTRWMLEDIPEKLKNNPGWKTLETSAIKYDGDGNPHSYWPEYWPLEKLESRRIEMDDDSLFRVSYLNDPSAYASAKFTVDGLSQKLPDSLPAFTAIYVGTDFAISVKKDADFTVFAAVGVDAAKNLYILDLQRIKVTPDVMVSELFQFAVKTATRFGKLTTVLIEKVAFQTVMKHVMADKYPSIPILPIPPIGDKGHRTEQFAILCNDGRVYFDTSNPFYKILKAEAMNFKIARHDDCLDAVSIVVQHIGTSIQNVKVRTIKSPWLL